MATLRAAVAGRWSQSALLAPATRARTPAAAPADRPARTRWAPSTPHTTAHAARWRAAQTADAQARAIWLARAAPAARALVWVVWPATTPADAAARAAWAARNAPSALAPRAAPWPPALAADPANRAAWAARALSVKTALRAPYLAQRSADATRRHPWGPFGRTLPGDWMVVSRPPGVTPVDPAFILPARFFMIAHELTAQRLPDLAPVPIFGVQLSADAGSYAWQFSAKAPRSVFDQLAPVAGVPQQLRITIDGIAFAFVVDRLQESERFGQRGAVISGRSITAALARPYAAETTRLNTAPATAQQLAAAALDLTGVALDWALTDWLVPAGAWSHTGTPLAAVQAIAEAAGGYVLSARNAPTLLVRHPYPTLQGGIPGGPWNWPSADPDVEIAPDALITRSIERADGPDINGLYVSGTTAGVIALVKRTGTAGNKLAPMVADALITEEAAARQRGTAILGAAGAKYLVQIDMPLLTGVDAPGVLDVGQLVEITEAQPWRGRVRAVSVSARHGGEVRQSVQIERHIET